MCMWYKHVYKNRKLSYICMSTTPGTYLFLASCLLKIVASQALFLYSCIDLYSGSHSIYDCISVGVCAGFLFVIHPTELSTWFNLHGFLVCRNFKNLREKNLPAEIDLGDYPLSKRELYHAKYWIKPNWTFMEDLKPILPVTI